MHQSVVDAWHSFSQPLEGRVNSLYCDVLGLITTGVGNLVDPIGLAEQLPWTLEDGSPADKAQLRADWHKLKDNAGYYSKRHWRFARDATKVRLTDDAIDNLVAQKRGEFEAYLKKHHFPEWDAFPADAQLGIMSMAWACGPGFPIKFGNFRRAVLAQDWEACVATCKIREAGNQGVVPRNAKNRFCFHNAQLVKDYGLVPSVLCWPDLPKIPSSAVHQASLARDAEQDALEHFVAVERERFLSEGPSAARDLREWEEADESAKSDTDPAPPVSEA